jgi:hypothetical protein
VAIFSRRSIQNQIDDLGAVLDAGDLKRLVNRLNGGDAQALATEWEVMILAGLSRLGHVQNEVTQGSSEPDISFRSHDDLRLEFLADVTAPSDDGLDDANAFDKLSRLVGQYAAKLGIPAGGFYIHAGYEELPVRGGYKVQLSMPNDGHMEAFFQAEVLPKVKIVAGHPGQPQEFSIPYGTRGIVIRYQPGTPYSGGGYRAYQNATSRENNPVYNALKLKQRQLKRANYTGPMGIIVCDGGCHILRHRLQIAQGTFSAKQIVARVLEQNTSISFVLLIGLTEELPHPFNRAEDPLAPRGELILNPAATHPLPEVLQAMLRKIPEKWPPPVQSPFRARADLDRSHLKGRKHRGQSFWGGYKRGGNMMRISARGLLELLAGEKTSAQFEDAHGLAGANAMANPFALALQAGQVIEKIEIIPATDKDDDWLEITLKGPNPALAKFKVPDQK